MARQRHLAEVLAITAYSAALLIPHRVNVILNFLFKITPTPQPIKLLFSVSMIRPAAHTRP